MALNFSTDLRFTGRRDSSDPTGYPYDTFIDGTKPNGTPLTYADVWKSIDGFLQSLLDAGKVTPSGTADKVGSSDYFDALMAQYGKTMAAYAPTATDATKGDYARSYFNYLIVRQSREPGTAYELFSSLSNGGITFGGTCPGNECATRRTYFDVDPTGLTYNSTNNTINYNPSGGLSLVGIPAGAAIQGMGIETRSTANSVTGTALNYYVSPGTDPVLTFAWGLWNTSTILSDVNRIWIDYDPSSVD